MRRLLVSLIVNDRAGAAAAARHLTGSRCRRKSARNPRFCDHAFVRRITITPNFGQAPVTLELRYRQRCLKARSGTSSGFLSPPAPRVWPAGPVEFRVRFNPQTLRAGFRRPDFYLRDRSLRCRAIQRAGDGGGAEHRRRAWRRRRFAPAPRRYRCRGRRRRSSGDAEALGLAAPVAELLPAPHDVVIGERVAAVLAAPDLDRHLAASSGTARLRRCALALGVGDVRRSSCRRHLERHRHAERLSLRARLRNRAFDRRLVAAEHMRRRR